MQFAGNPTIKFVLSSDFFGDGLYLKISICEFLIILLDHITKVKYGGKSGNS